MSKKDISKFLPKHLRNEDVRSFISTTTQTLFDEEQSEYVNQYIGRKVGGTYDHTADPYAIERTKLRQDYQLEPALTLHDAQTNDVNGILFFEDLLHTIRANGVDTSSHERLFIDTSYTFAPPIDYDMFLNYSNYYWVPEGAPAVRLAASKEQINGQKTFSGLVSGSGEYFFISNGNHLILEDGNEYIVSGVGDQIRLIEFDLSNNKPMRVSLRSGASSDNLISLFPKEYLTIERGSVDNSPWTRNNAWYHVDVLYPTVDTVTPVLDNVEERRALRPIIQYRRDLELFNYVGGQGTPVDARFMSHEELPISSNYTIDGITIFEGMQVVRNDSGSIFTFLGDDSGWREEDTISNRKVVVTNGLTYRGEELQWKGDGWEVLQRKVSDTQDIRFNIYNSQDPSKAVSLSSIPGSNFNGLSIFGYKTSGGGLTYDNELGMSVAMHTGNTGSDFLFTSTLSAYSEEHREFVDQHTEGLYYKVLSGTPSPSDRLYRFAIGTDRNGDPAVFVNGTEMPTLSVEANIPYTLDFSDSSTSRDGIFGETFTISIIEVETNFPLVQHAHAKAYRSVYDVAFREGYTYQYTTKINNQEVFGSIIVTSSDHEFHLQSEYQKSLPKKTRLLQTLEVEDVENDNTVLLRYTPTSDSSIRVRVSGANMEFSVVNRTVVIDSSHLTDRTFIEVEYETNEVVSGNYSDVIQLPPLGLTNNPFNDTPTTFKHSDIFEHMGDVIESQHSFEGSPFGRNNYRDTIKDTSIGGRILKNRSSVVPVMFMNYGDDMNVMSSIDVSRQFYQNFKNQLILETEDYVRDRFIDNNNIVDAFDLIVSKINVGKMNASPFSNTGMFATGRSYVNVSYDNHGVIDTEFTWGSTTALYIQVINRGTVAVDEDYDIVYLSEVGKYKIVPKTFSLTDIVLVRLYTEMTPCFCPATPQKIGLLPCHLPSIQVDASFENPIGVIIGHDGSRTRSYTSVKNIALGDLDVRDTILLEFERRVYNTIDSSFRMMDSPLVPIEPHVSSHDFNSYYSQEEVDEIKHNLFFKWCNDSHVDYTENTTYKENDHWTFNYSSAPSFDGSTLKGHWRGIYLDYFGTTTPHQTPWELLGFTKEPVWWVSEYGNDYTSGNTKMWSDLRDGIIRGGKRSNTKGMRYQYENPFRRPHLMDILPVDGNGNLLSPIDCNIAGYPDQSSIRNKWKIGDCSPVEWAWRSMSDYQFAKVAITYALRPVEFCSVGWDSKKSLTETYNNIWEYKYSTVHSDETFVAGISLWMYDLLKDKNVDVVSGMKVPFENINLSLSYKVGGYINRNELRITSDSSTPTSEGNTSNNIPMEDIHLLTYKSKDIEQKVYSGVIVERIRVGRDRRPFVEGAVYHKDDIIYNDAERTFYRKAETTILKEWVENTRYRVGEEVQHANTQYTCVNEHVSSDVIEPSTSPDWQLREFKSYEWVVLINPPKATSTAFKVYGYDISRPYFSVIRPVKSSNVKTITAYGPGSKPVDIASWSPNTPFKEGTIVSFNGSIYEAFKNHTSSINFDSNDWVQLSEVPRTNKIDVNYYADAGHSVEDVAYHTVYNTMEEVVEFLTSYGRFMASEGWLFNTVDRETNVRMDWIMSASEFVDWAVENQHEGAVIALSPVADYIQLKTDHGVVSLKEQHSSSIFNILGFNGNPIDQQQIKVTRDSGVFRLRSDVPIFYLKLGIKEYEHALVFNNKTIFGDINYDPILGARIDRLWMRGTKTNNWDGRLYAPGFIITEDGITPNFDTSAKDITNFNNMSVVSSRGLLNDLKYHNLGYQRRQYLEDLDLDNKSQIDFYSGFIRQKGTNNAYKKILRSNIVSGRDNMDVSEEWAFKEQLFGGVSNYSQVEFNLRAEEFADNPQFIHLNYNGEERLDEHGTIEISLDNIDEWVTPPRRFTDEGGVFMMNAPKPVYRDAGYALYHEHEMKASNFNTLSTRMKELEIEYDIGMTVWLSADNFNGDSWSVYLLDNTKLVVTEILDGGTDRVNGTILRANNVAVEKPYSIIDKEGERRTVVFYHIREDIYMAIDSDENHFVSVDEGVTPEDLSILQWKPLRISSDPLYRNIDSVERHLERYDITPYDGMLLYKDEELYGSGNWNVYEYDTGVWSSIRQATDIVDNSMIDEVAMYDREGNLIENLRIFDPLLGFIPGARTDCVDFISSDDPINYTTGNTREFSKFTNIVGKVWWDTSVLIYVNYHIGDIAYRRGYWGSLFPDSEVNVYEWVRSSVPPEEYEGEVKNFTDYIVREEYDYDLAMYSTNYYFWAKNRAETDEDSVHSLSANQIASTIRHPSNNGFGLVYIIDNHNLTVLDEAQTMMMNDTTLKIAYKIKETNANAHTQWFVITENATYSDIPSFIFDKMKDSVVGYDLRGNAVPSNTLSETSKYGNSVGQSWFKNQRNAMEIFLEIVNEHLRRINLAELGINIEDRAVNLRESEFTELVPWYADMYDKDVVISKVMRLRADIYHEDNIDGEYIRVLESSGNLEDWSIYRWNATSLDVDLVAKSNAVVQLKPSKVFSELSDEEKYELRRIIDVIFNDLTTGDYRDIFNRILFAMVRYSMVEHPNNDWVFPTTYASVIEDNVVLKQLETYQGNTQSDVSRYIREAKPYHTKLRNFDRMYRVDSDGNEVKIRVTDFDNPVYFAQGEPMHIMRSKKIEWFKPSGREYSLSHVHENEVVVMDDGIYVPPSNYVIEDKVLKLNYTPREGRNHVYSIVIDSRDLDVQERQEQWIRTRGYATYLRDTFNHAVWEELSIQKHTAITLDNFGVVNRNAFEELVNILDENVGRSDLLAAIDELGQPDHENNVNIKDRFILTSMADDMREIIEESMLYIHDNIDPTHEVPYDGAKAGMVMLVNSRPVADALWWLSGDHVHTNFPIYHGYKVEIRPYRLLVGMYLKTLMVRGLSQNSSYVATPTFDDDYLLPILSGQNTSLVVDNVEDYIDGVVETVLVEVEVEDEDDIDDEDGSDDEEVNATSASESIEDENEDVYEISFGSFTNVHDGATDELVGLKVHESLIMTYINREPILEQLGEVDKIGPRDYFDTITIDTEGGKSEYDVTLNVDPYLVYVNLDGRRLISDVHYKFTEKTIVLTSAPDSNGKLVITDEKNTKEYDTLVDAIVNTKRAGGGYYVNRDTGSVCDDELISREFVIYGRSGHRTLLKTPLYDYFRFDSFNAEESRIEFIEGDAEDISIENSLFAIVEAKNIDLENDANGIDFEIVRGTISENGLVLHNRGLFNDEQLSMQPSNSRYIYRLHYEENMSEYIVHGSKEHSDNYPKLAHIIFRTM